MGHLVDLEEVRADVDDAREVGEHLGHEAARGPHRSIWEGLRSSITPASLGAAPQGSRSPHDGPERGRMTATVSTFTSPSDATALTTYTWDDVTDPVGAVQVAHGLAEHGARYERLALNAAGFVVHATDHRGHGASIHRDAGRLRGRRLRRADRRRRRVRRVAAAVVR